MIGSERSLLNQTAFLLGDQGRGIPSAGDSPKDAWMVRVDLVKFADSLAGENGKPI
jgi:hypothetical protein